MPTYEYKCRECDHTLEKFQSMNDAHLTECPECNKETLKRLIGTGAGIIFKGSGFYQTDYRSDSYNKSAQKDKKSDSDKKIENKPAADKSKKSVSPKAE